MGKFTEFITKTMIYSLRVVMIVIVLDAILLLGNNMNFTSTASILQIVFLAISGVGFYFLLKKKRENIGVMLGYILLIALVTRGFWILNANTVPVSDFKTMFSSAQNFLIGDYSAFWGTSYIARFPHLTVMVLYFAAMIKMFADPILVMKIVNLALSLLTVFLIYKICYEVFEDKVKAAIGGYIAAIFPPFITYVSIFCTENIAIPFYLLSIYLFILFIKDKKGYLYLVLSSASLVVGNLFRMVAAVTLIAFICFIILYYKDKILDKVKAGAVIIIPFAILFFGVSSILQGLQITEFPLWKGSEPAITNILKGTNIESKGRWNPEDAAVPELCNYDYEKMEEMSKEIIKERLTETPPLELIKFYIEKIANQWSLSDLEGIFWTELSTNGEGMKIPFRGGSNFILQLIYAVAIVLSYIGLFNKKRNTEKLPVVNLFYIIFCGYGLSYLITETQGRYAYIVCWLFIILGISGLERISKWKSL